MDEQELRNQIASDLERQATFVLMSSEYNFNDTAIFAKTFVWAAKIVRGNNE